ncbi:MAG: HAD family hydrolase [Syntrophobacteraceae bacterium]
MLIWLDSPPAGGRRFLLLDRDGVINENRPDYVKNIREFRTYPDALEALELLNRKGVSVVIVSNQSGINRGLIAWDDFWEMHDEMVRQVEQRGGRILAALYCPHRPDENCGCRKPSPAMIEAACRLFEVNPREMFFIGDHDTDIVAAHNAGCKGVRIWRESRGQAPANIETGGGPVFTNLLDAVLSIYG